MSMQHGPSSLSATNLACIRGERMVFEGLGFELANGGLLQVSGPNGSGKTSLLRMICGLIRPATGQIEWNGQAIDDLGDEYGCALTYVGHLSAIKDELTASENLHFSARIQGLPHDEKTVKSLIGEFGLNESAQLPCKVLSQGQRRRLALARLKLSASRALWVLDEPFTALDSAGVGVMRTALEAHLAQGGLALLTTHQEVPITAARIQRLELRH
jgi:heme exporter protein A